MPAIIRATDRNSGSTGVLFNFDDMTAEANRYLQKVKAEAVKIVAKAQQEALAVRKQAEHDGRQAALQSVEGMVQKQMTEVLPALRQAVEEIQHAKQAWLRHWEAAGVHVAGAIAARLVRRELQQQPEISLALLREALELAAGNAQMRLRVNPQDQEILGSQIQSLVKELAPLAETEIVADPEISRGGCRVETRFGAIDQQFEAQIQRIEEELAQ
jgi:flagellar assembly protein FliH